jgi:tRNA(Ile)-lysidine synthase
MCSPPKPRENLAGLRIDVYYQSQPRGQPSKIMHKFLVQLHDACQRLRLNRTRLMVGVSGGADSVALLCGLQALSADGGLLLHAAHLNHLLRGAASDADAAWVRELCRSLKLPLTEAVFPVAQAAQEEALGVEEAARSARYAFLAKAAVDAGCPIVAVAHTADDLAETVLHHVLRGTGLAGLRGIPEERDLEGVRLARPLLRITKRCLQEYLQTERISYREDATNLDTRFTRNRIRHQLLPQLREQFNPKVDEALRRLGLQAEEAQNALDSAAQYFLDRALREAQHQRCSLHWQVLAPLGRHLVREVLAALWRRQGWPRQRMAFEHWQALADATIHGGAVCVPGGVVARRDGKLLVIESGRQIT